ncbi:MAG: hypothetical protein V3T86_12530 [Planctomycetota bacterium]
MHRQISLFALALLAMGLFLATPAAADDTAALREEVKQLQERLDNMTQSGLDQEVEDYLASNQASQNAQGGSRWDDVTVHFRFLAQGVASVGYGEDATGTSNDHDVQGLADLDFDFNITENLRGFIYLTTRSGNRATGLPLGQGTTAAGLTDGIGTDGNTGVTGTGLAVYETGLEHAMALGSTTLHWQVGKLDPRTRFGQNAYADSAHTQFMNNGFTDSSAILWTSTATNPNQYAGMFGWIELGANKNMTLAFGWFNATGQFFNNGQFYIQLHIARESNGRPMNIRIFGTYDKMNLDASGDGYAGGGVSFDMKATDTLGVFVRVVANGSDVNPVDLDAVVGVAWNVSSSRPDDVLGIGVGWASLQNVTQGSFAPLAFGEDTELTVEVYYNRMEEGGKLQITPFLQFISDPAQTTPVRRSEDSIFLLGLRIFVHF